MQIISDELAGQVAIVTGGGRGLGRAMAQTLAKAGATVAVVARSENQLAETVALIENAGGRAIAIRGDVTVHRSVRQTVDKVERQIGPVSLLVNNAGDPGPIGPVWQVNVSQWWYCMNVNLRGPFLCARAVLPGMLRRRRGRIINVSSGAGLEPLAYDSAYVTSKTALVRLNENIAAETKEYGISVFAIDPGTVRTAMTESVLESAEMQKWMPWLRDIFEEGRDASPERAAQLVRFLASGRADALSGCFISIFDDVEEMIARATEIERESLYALRLRKST